MNSRAEIRYKKISKSVPVVSLMTAGLDGIQDFQKRKELGQSTTEALERTAISIAGSEWCYCWATRSCLWSLDCALH